MGKPSLEVRFFKTNGGTEPVRDWLRELSEHDRKTIGKDIKTVQFGWPTGMPLVRKNGQWPLGSAYSFGWSHCASAVHGVRWHDRFASRLYKKISGNAET